MGALWFGWKPSFLCSTELGAERNLASSPPTGFLTGSVFFGLSHGSEYMSLRIFALTAPPSGRGVTAKARLRLDRYSGASEYQSAFAVRLRATGFVIETLAGGHGGGGSSLTLMGSRGPFSSAQKVRRGFHSACAAQNT